MIHSLKKSFSAAHPVSNVNDAAYGSAKSLKMEWSRQAQGGQNSNCRLPKSNSSSVEFSSTTLSPQPLKRSRRDEIVKQAIFKEDHGDTIIVEQVSLPDRPRLPRGTRSQKSEMKPLLGRNGSCLHQSCNLLNV
jgi:hypothetical protein